MGQVLGFIVKINGQEGYLCVVDDGFDLAADEHSFERMADVV